MSDIPQALTASAQSEPADRPEKASAVTWLDITERIVKMVSIAAIPVVIPLALAFYSARVQQGAQRQTINRDYVELAVSILKEKPDNVRPDLRNWAVDLLAEYSPTKFSPEVISGLKEGEFSFPGILGTLPGKIGALSPNAKFIAVAQGARVSLSDLTTRRTKELVNMHSKVVGLDFSPDSQFLATAGENGAVSVINPGSGKIIGHFTTGESISAIRFSVGGQVQVAATSGAVYLFSRRGALLGRVVPPAPPGNLTATPK